MRNKEIQELVLMRHSLNAIREVVSRELDAMAAKIERLLPEEKMDTRVPTLEELLEIVNRKKGGRS